MAKLDLIVLKGYVVRYWKPTVTQVKNWMDSFWHKDDPIPIASITGLTTIINSLPSTAAINALINQLAPVVVTQDQPSFLLEANKNVVMMRIESDIDDTVMVIDASSSQILAEIEVKAYVPSLEAILIAGNISSTRNIAFNTVSSNIKIMIYKR